MIQVKVAVHNGIQFYLVQITQPPAVGFMERFTQVLPGAKMYKTGVYVTKVNLRNCLGLTSMGADMNGKESIRFSKLPLVAKMYPLRDYQKDTAVHILNNPRCLIASTQQVGKTASTIVALKYLNSEAPIKGVLVIAPLTVVESVWPPAIEDLYPGENINVLRNVPTKYRVITKGNKTVRKKVTGPKSALVKLKDARRLAAYAPPDQPTWYVTNIDTLAKEDIFETLAAMLASGEITVVIIDESTIVGNSEAARTKRMRALLASAPYASIRVVGISGTPGGAEKSYSQATVIDPKKCPFTLQAWKNLTMTKIPLGDTGIVKWIEKENWEVIAYKYLPATVRFKREDTSDLVLTTEYLSVKMSAEQQQAYDEVMQQAMLSFKDKHGNLTHIDIEHIMTETSKALQISSGTAIIGNGEVLELDYSPRLDLIVELIKNAPSKTIIFNTYVETCYRLQRDLAEEGLNFKAITGATKNRKEIVDSIQNDPNVHGAIVHAATVAYGVDLTAASTLIFNGSVLGGAFLYAQARERCSSQKQKEKEVRIFEISSSPIEDKYWASLKLRGDIEATLLAYFEEMMVVTK